MCFLVMGPVQADPDDLRSFVDLLLKAAELPSVEKLAVVLNVDVKQLRKELRAEGHLSLTRIIAQLGRVPWFWSRLGMELIKRDGPPPEARMAAKVVELVDAAQEPSQQRSA